MPTTIYRDSEGNRVKSVTTICNHYKEDGGGALAGAANKLGLEGQKHYEVWGRLAKLGTIVHEYVQNEWLGKSNEALTADVPDDLKEYFANCVRAWDQCKSEVKFGDPLSVEQNFVSDEFGFGGCPDVAVTMGNPAILDIKTGRVFPEVVMQLAAYRHLYNENKAEGDHPAKCGYVVQLNRESGNYKLHYYSEETMDLGWKWFRAMQYATEISTSVRKRV